MYRSPPGVDVPLHAALAALNLNTLNKEQLKDFLNDDDNLDQKIKGIAELRSLESQRDRLIASNRSVSEYNQSYEPRIAELQEAVRSRQLEADQLSEQLRKYQLKLDTGPQALPQLLARLQKGATEAEEEAESLVKSLLEGDSTVENFIKQYLPLRTLAIQRRVKVDKLKEQQRSGGRTPHRPPPPTPLAAAAIPYPLTFSPQSTQPPPAVPTGYPYSPSLPSAAPPYPVSQQQSYPTLPYPIRPSQAMPVPRF